MPLFKDFSDNDAQIFMWKYSEADGLDIDELLEEHNREKFKGYAPKRLLETLMVRRILKEKLPAHQIFYSADGAPTLLPKTCEISISHSFPFAAVALSTNKIGIDLERMQEKIRRLKDKFILPGEQFPMPEAQEVKFLTIIWSIKESLYKMHHSKHWSLKQHYTVMPFSLENLEEISCRVHDDGSSEAFSARVELFDGYVFSVVR